MRFLVVHIVAAVLIAAAGCDTLEPSQRESEVVVESYLVAGEPFSIVRLTRTLPLDTAFDADSLGITGANVRIERLDETGSVEDTIQYEDAPRRPGVYRPASPGRDSIIVVETTPNDDSASSLYRGVEPLRTYRLVADVPGSDELITSVTTVPDTFSTLRVDRDSVVYRSDDPLVFYLTPPHYPGRQSFFILTTVALDGHEDDLTPFARALHQDGDVTLGELRISTSPLLNEESFTRIEGGELRVQYPWLGVNFYGRTRVVLQALDDNMYDFLRSQSVQQGGSTLPPGEIPNVLEHVEGGRGIFGSTARATTDFVVARNPDID